jgi:hypothetical protein
MMMLDIKTVFIGEVHQLQTKLFVCVCFVIKPKYCCRKFSSFNFFLCKKKKVSIFLFYDLSKCWIDVVTFVAVIESCVKSYAKVFVPLFFFLQVIGLACSLLC